VRRPSVNAEARAARVRERVVAWNMPRESVRSDRSVLLAHAPHGHALRRGIELAHRVDAPRMPRPASHVARRIVVRLWGKFGNDAERNGASTCIPIMPRIDPGLALRWSADHGHREDGRAREAAAEMLAEQEPRSSEDDAGPDRPFLPPALE
jgi:hypothetical protein